MGFLSYMIRFFDVWKVSPSQVELTLTSSRNIFGFEKEKNLKELLEKDVRNSNDFLEVFNYPSEEREGGMEWGKSL